MEIKGGELLILGFEKIIKRESSVLLLDLA